MKIALWIVLVVALILGVLWEFYPLPDASQRLSALPESSADFDSEDIPITEEEKKYFTDVNVIKRRYSIGDKHYFIYLLDGTHNRHAIHDPTYCFRGGGWSITKEKHIPLRNGYGTLFKLKKGNSTKNVLMWFSNERETFSSPMRYWWETTLRRLSLGGSGQEPVLIVVQPLYKEKTDWEAFFKAFPQLQNI
ncbi:MAG: hypothetical protein Tsb0021_14720 [Chlamydiales bacterium]